MSSEKVIKAGDFDKYVCVDPMIMVMDSKPYTYYLFDKDDKLVCVGYISEDADSDESKFKQYFKDAGWKSMGTVKKNGQKTTVYTKDDQYGGLYISDGTVMTMIFSDDLSDEIIDGADVNDIIGI